MQFCRERERRGVYCFSNGEVAVTVYGPTVLLIWSCLICALVWRIRGKSHVCLCARTPYSTISFNLRSLISHHPSNDSNPAWATRRHFSTLWNMQCQTHLGSYIGNRVFFLNSLRGSNPPPFKSSYEFSITWPTVCQNIWFSDTVKHYWDTTSYSFKKVLHCNF